MKYNIRKYNKLLCLLTYGSQEWAVPPDHYVFLWYEINDTALADSFLFKAKWFQIILYESNSYDVHNVLRKGLVQLSLQYKAW